MTAGLYHYLNSGWLGFTHGSLYCVKFTIIIRLHFYFAASSVRGEDCGSYPALVGNMVGEKLYKVNAQSITKLPQLFYPEISLRNKIQNFHNLSETFDR